MLLYGNLKPIASLMTFRHFLATHSQRGRMSLNISGASAGMLVFFVCFFLCSNLKPIASHH